MVYIDCSTTAHDQAVIAAVRGYLNRASSQVKGEIPAGMRIHLALMYATDARERDGRSTDPTLRDAEYYLHGLYASSNRDTAHAYAVAGAPLYNAFKSIAHAFKDAGFEWFEKQMRVDPNMPTSKPGGWEWAYRGLLDGIKIDEDKETQEAPTPDLLTTPSSDRILP